MSGLSKMFTRAGRAQRLEEALVKLRQRLPVPVFWLFGKTQSGKTSLIRFLTGAEQAEIGRGFKPCTRFSRQYQFPSEEAPLLSFRDTRGLDEPGYNAAEDIAAFNNEAHVVLVTVKALDHAQENVVENLRAIRAASPRRPVVLVLTCLHEAYPQQQHPQPYPFGPDATVPLTERALPDDLVRSIAAQKERFAGLVDRVVAVDITPKEEGFNDPDYGGPKLLQTLIDVLPAALGQTLLAVDQATHELSDLYAHQAMPYILGYSTMAATAGAFPVPLLDMLLVSGIQSRMIYELADLYGQPMTGKRFLEMAGSLGIGMLARQAARGLIKLIPGVGSVIGAAVGGALAGASTYALGKAFCHYYRVVHQGHIPKPEDLRRYYREQLHQAEAAWKHKMRDSQGAPQP